MKPFRLVLMILLVAGLLNCFVVLLRPQGQGGSETFHEIGAFREVCLKNMKKHELIQSQSFDLDGDGILEKYILYRGRITVLAGPHIIWRSSQDWWVDHFFLGDVDNDGAPELSLWVWKGGSFGPCKPFWVEKEDPSVKNHLFIFKLENGSFKPIWQSSNLDCPHYWAILIDLNDDGENKLAVIEGSYTDPGKRRVTFWEWNGWGFSRIYSDFYLLCRIIKKTFL